MNFDMWMQLLRYSLLSLGPVVASHGYATGDQWTTITAGVVWVVTFAWGVYVKFGTKSVLDHVDVSTVSPATGRSS